MGINKRLYYDMYCDGCGKNLADTFGHACDDVDDIRVAAIKSGWAEINGKWYCPYCYHLDDENDEYVPNKEEKVL